MNELVLHSKSIIRCVYVKSEPQNFLLIATSNLDRFYEYFTKKIAISFV